MLMKHTIKFRKAILDSKGVFEYYTLCDASLYELVYKLAAQHHCDIIKLKIRERCSDLRSVIKIKPLQADANWNDFIADFLGVLNNKIENISIK